MAGIPGFVPSNITLNPYSQAYVDGANVQIAPWVMGTFADLFLQGILAAQTANYFSYRDADGSHRRFAWLVIVLTILCLLKSAQNITIVWDTVIAAFANPDVSMMLVATNWWHYTTSLSTALIATFVQCFFVYRYWMLTKRWYVCAVMVVGMVISLIAAILVIHYLRLIQHATIKKWSLVHFVAAITVDTLITAGTALHLYKKKTSIQSTSEMIDRLVRMTWQTALPPTLCVIVNAVVLETRPLELTHIAFNMVLPKLYAVSLLYTLNIRNEMRTERMTSHERSTGTHPGPTHVGGKRSFIPNDLAYRSAGNVERGVSFVAGRGRGMSGGNTMGGRRVDGIHVETHISTHGGSSGNNVEMDTFDGKPAINNVSDFDKEVWEGDKRYMAQ
ncbi:SubName: Full=Uncharacterized protein {ECO:0000313/EMBL:CCA72913.1} [Serendipita indica DSM 11827]|uniref:DUF6534 domain-containing protein n=1 Tax=Serendipita indica (strain DSM 11827) TaxID=1109443 RepID=G4TNM0_SERID|nr:SubName: Full=Uncharacterized protein {ECO:0000313/EMBL:CCA72913.1} [Serendipita indica DSM 11827]CCA72913.1 hypothetical protein PIIN_06849 [Serendipita indica DSM 11827]